MQPSAVLAAAGVKLAAHAADFAEAAAARAVAAAVAGDKESILMHAAAASEAASAATEYAAAVQAAATAADEGQAAVCALSAEVKAASTSADKARYFASAAADADLPPAEGEQGPSEGAESEPTTKCDQGLTSTIMQCADKDCHASPRTVLHLRCLSVSHKIVFLFNIDSMSLIGTSILLLTNMTISSCVIAGSSSSGGELADAHTAMAHMAHLAARCKRLQDDKKQLLMRAENAEEEMNTAKVGLGTHKVCC